MGDEEETTQEKVCRKLLTQAIWKDCSLKDHRLDRNLVPLSEDSSEINAHLVFTKCLQKAMLFINCPLIVLITVNSKASLQLPWSCLSKFNVNLIILPHYFICNGGNINQACPLTRGESGQVNSTYHRMHVTSRTLQLQLIINLHKSECLNTESTKISHKKSMQWALVLQIYNPNCGKAYRKNFSKCCEGFSLFSLLFPVIRHVRERRFSILETLQEIITVIKELQSMSVSALVDLSYSWYGCLWGRRLMACALFNGLFE